MRPPPHSRWLPLLGLLPALACGEGPTGDATPATTCTSCLASQAGAPSRAAVDSSNPQGTASGGAAGATTSPRAAVEAGAAGAATSPLEASAALGLRCGTVVSGIEAERAVSVGAVLLDVRSPAEFTSSHLEGASNAPLDTLPEALASWDPETPLVAYCASGSRSQRATAALLAAGLCVFDLGAMSNWPSSDP